MNPEMFSIIGYVGLALSAGAILLWLVYWKAKVSLLAIVALGCTVIGAVCSKVNSATHVNRIDVDPSIAMAEVEARQEAKRKAMLDSRGEEVADIRFAEDSGSEFLDKAGMDEADLKYMESLNDDAEPAWKKEKKSRSNSALCC